MDINKDIELVSNLKNIELKGKVNEQYIYAKIPEEYLNAIENVLEELEIKDKMIDEMATYLADMDFDDCCAEMPEPCLCCSWEDYEPHTQCIKEYFRKKAQNE